jgi:hypothetical protein
LVELELTRVRFAESGTYFGTRIDVRPIAPRSRRRCRLVVRRRAEDQVMPPAEPRIIRWTDHALTKAELLSSSRADVETAVLEGHGRRTRNTGAADWLISAGRLAIAYNHPDGDDDLAALIVTLWRRA